MNFTTSLVGDPYREYGFLYTDTEANSSATQEREEPVTELVRQAVQPVREALARVADKAVQEGSNFMEGAAIVLPLAQAHVLKRYAAGSLGQSIPDKAWVNPTPEQNIARLTGHFASAFITPFFTGENHQTLFVQKDFLARYPKYILRKLSPGAEQIVDTHLAKALRIGITALRFASFASRPDRNKSEAALLGLICGSIAESHLGFMGAYGAVVAHNLMTKDVV